MNDMPPMSAPSGRPPILILLCLFTALLAVALGLAALAPAPGASAEEPMRVVPCSPSGTIQADGAKPPSAS